MKLHFTLYSSSPLVPKWLLSQMVFFERDSHMQFYIKYFTTINMLWGYYLNCPTLYLLYKHTTKIQEKSLHNTGWLAGWLACYEGNTFYLQIKSKNHWISEFRSWLIRPKIVDTSCEYKRYAVSTHAGTNKTILENTTLVVITGQI